MKLPRKKRKLSFKEKREFEELEIRIATTERRIESLEKQMTENPSDYQLIQQFDEELTALKIGLERDVERWAELAEYV